MTWVVGKGKWGVDREGTFQVGESASGLVAAGRIFPPMGSGRDVVACSGRQLWRGDGCCAGERNEVLSNGRYIMGG